MGKNSHILFVPRLDFSLNQLGIVSLLLISFGLIFSVYFTVLKVWPGTFALDSDTNTWTCDTAHSSDFSFDPDLVTVDDNGCRPVDNYNKFTNPTFDSNVDSWDVSLVGPLTWVEVPGDPSYSTDNFWVMKYEAKCSSTSGLPAGLTSPDSDPAWHIYSDGDSNCTSANNKRVVSAASGYPIANISQGSSIARCSSITSGSHLITNNEWMTIARNAETQPGNWSEGSIGSGYLFAGHNDSSPDFALPASTTDTGDNACAYTNAGGNQETPSPCPSNTANGTSATAGNQKRVLVLSNGSSIWDFAGNVSEFADNNILGEDMPPGTNDGSYVEWTTFSPPGINLYNSLSYDQLRPSVSDYDSNYGIGAYAEGSANTGVSYIYNRGGDWQGGINTGAFSLNLSYGSDVVNTDNGIPNMGFRCAINSNPETISQDFRTAGFVGGGDTVTLGGVYDGKIVQQVNVGDSSTYDLSVYVAINNGPNYWSTVNSSIAELYYNGNTIPTTYTPVGGGWWKLSGTLVGANESREYGVLIKAGLILGLDNFILSKSGSYSIYTNSAFNSPDVNTWSSFIDSTTDVAQGIGPDSVTSADFNGDGETDLVTSNRNGNNITVFLNKGDGTFNVGRNYPLNGISPRTVAAGDVNNDGKVDIIVANRDSNNISIFINVGDGSFENGVTYSTIGTGTRSLAIADFNRDGYIDIANANFGTNNITVLTNIGDGTFDSGTSYATDLYPAGLASGDFNGDSWPDLAVANTNSNTISIFLNNGDGTFGTPLSIPTGANYPWIITVKDLNHDGIADLAIDFEFDNIQIALGNGDGTFNMLTAFPTDDHEPLSITSDDFDSDGNMDLVVANITGHQFELFNGVGDGTFSSGVEYSVITGDTSSVYDASISTADYNSDGYPDLAVTDYRANSVDVFPNDGSGIFNTKESYSTITNSNTYSGVVGYQICLDDGVSCSYSSGSRWEYYTGGAWTLAADDSLANSNNSSELTQTAIYALPVVNHKISVKAIMGIGEGNTPKIFSFTVGEQILPSLTPTNTPVITDTLTSTPTNTANPTITNTQSPTNTPHLTNTPHPTSTPHPGTSNTPVPTLTRTPTLTPTITPTATDNAIPTPTTSALVASSTPVPTFTINPTVTPSNQTDNAGFLQMIESNLFSTPAKTSSTLVAAGIAGTASTLLISSLAYPQWLSFGFLWITGRKKRKPWGIVYDQNTNEPIALAVVLLTDKQTGMVIKRTITDMRGRFEFVADIGSYTISASQEGYDEYQKDFVIQNNDVGIVMDIPLVKTGELNFWKTLLLGIKRNLRKISIVLTIFGLLFTLVSLGISPNPINIGVFIIYLIQIAIFVMVQPAIGWGKILDSQTNEPVKGAFVRLIDIDEMRQIDVQLADKKGRFGFIVDKKDYYIRADASGYKFPAAADSNKTITNPAGISFIKVSNADAIKDVIKLDPL